MLQYRTKDGDVLDWIAWRYYGNESAAIALLDENPGLADQPAVLPSGLLITLPDLPIGKPSTGGVVVLSAQ